MSGPGAAPAARPVLYRFGAFTVSARRRQLLHAGREVPLIPRYFDLLLLLLRRRDEAVSRRDILEVVWSDVVVSDGALTQAVRTLRRALGDDPREPAFIRTVSRHGYRFVHDGVAEEPDDAGPAPGAEPVVEPEPAGGDGFEPALQRLLAAPGDAGAEAEAERYEAAEALHALGTAEALRLLDQRPGHAQARAILRDTRWNVPHAGDVPLLGAPGWPAAVGHLVRLRLHRALGLAGRRWGSASAGGALAGMIGGLLGALVLRLAPGSDAPTELFGALVLVGGFVGGLGAAGVGAGLAAAEALARSWRSGALVAFGAVGGWLVGAAAHEAFDVLLEVLFGRGAPGLGGGFEGLALGAAAGLGYALGTPRAEGGMATPHGRERVTAVLRTALVCAAAGIALSFAGGHLAGASLNALGRAFQGSHLGLQPLARLLGEANPGPVTWAVLGGSEAFLFGGGVAYGLTRRPHRRNGSAVR